MVEIGWTAHRSDDPDASKPHCGDLWTLTWDGSTLAHVMVSAVKPDHVLAWPVTMPGQASFRPGIILDSPLGCQVTAWPTRETGIGNHLLGQRLGGLLPAATVRSISWALDEDEDPEEVQWAEDWGSEDDEEAFAAHWTELCFHTGRTDDDECFLSETKARAVGGRATVLATVLALDPEETRSAWLGERPLTPEQVLALAKALDAEPAELLGPDPAYGLWLRLAEPIFKKRVVETATEAGLTETQVRLFASRDAYVLAARDDGSARTQQKLLDALRRIASAGSAS